MQEHGFEVWLDHFNRLRQETRIVERLQDGGQCLASLVLEQRDEWATLPLCTREVPSLPPEPFRVLGARAIRWGFITCEEALQAGRREPLLARALAAVPSALGLHIGTR